MQKRNIIIVILVIIVAAGAVSASFLLRPKLDKIDINHDGGQKDADLMPQILTRTFSEDTSTYKVQVEYPELKDVSAPGAQDTVNAAIKEQVFNQVAGFHSAIASNLPPSGVDLKSSFDGRFETVLLTRSFFSGLMYYTDYSSGAAHPNNYLVALNYDLRSGQVVSLEQVFRALNASAGYMDRLSAYVKKDLVKQLGDTEDSVAAIDSGAAPSAENYSNFTLDQGGLAIHFDPYQVAAYAAGAPTVKIPYSDLSTVIAKPAASQATSTVKWWL